MHRNKGNANPAGHRIVPICSLRLGGRAYIITGCDKMQKYVSKISEKSHFAIRHYAPPCQGRNRKLWPGCTTTYLPLPAPKVLCNSTKSWFKSENLPLVSVRTNLPASSAFLALWLRKFAYFWCCHIKSYLKIFIQVHIYKIYACSHLHLVSEMIYYVSSGTFNPTHSRASTIQ